MSDSPLPLLLFFPVGTASTVDGRVVTTTDLLVFFTGADGDPPLGFPQQPHLTFTDSGLATANSCSLILKLPVGHCYDVFREKMIESLMGHGGQFGRL